MTPPVIERTRDYLGIPTREIACAGAGPAVVLLHGVFDQADTWRGVLEHMAASGRRAVAVDLPHIHHRQVGQPILPPLDAFVAAVIDACADAEGVVLVGNSMGGGLALRAALNPELPVRIAVPIAIPGFGYRPLVTAVFGRYGPSESTLSRLRLPRSVFRSRLAIPVVRRVLHYRGRTSDLTQTRHFLDRLGRVDHVGELLAAGRALLAEFDAGYAQGDPTPVLFLHGRNDTLIPPTAAHRARNRYAGSEAHILDCAGHCPQLDQPRRIAELIIEFDARASRAA